MAPSAGLPQVLVVDGDAQNRALLVEVLAAEGFAVTAVEDGTEALGLLATETYDLVVAEATLAPVSGLDLVRAANDLDPATRPPVVLLSASPLGALRRAAEAEGAAIYLEKPFRVFDLTDRIRRLLRQAPRSEGPPTLPAIRLARATSDALVELPSGPACRGTLRRALTSLGHGECVTLSLVRVEEETFHGERPAWTAFVGALAAMVTAQSAGRGKVFRVDDGELAWVAPGDHLGEAGSLSARVLAESGRQSQPGFPGAVAVPAWTAAVLVRGPSAMDEGRLLRFGRSLLVRARREAMPFLVDEVHEDTIPDSRKAPSSNKTANDSSRRPRISSTPPRKPRQ